MHDFDQFERHLADALRSDSDASVGPFEAGSVAQAAIAASQSGATRLPRASSRLARRFGRGRGLTLLAAALLLGGGALAAGSGILRLLSLVPPVPSPSLVAIATASPGASSPGPSELAGPSADPIPVAGPGGAWIPTGSMVTPREGYSAVRLQDGRVLVVGGYSGPSGYAHDLTSTELYDPATGTWSATGSISRPLVHEAVTVLRDGRVLVLVGHVEDGPSGAEVYDPASGAWTATGPMASGADKIDGSFTVLRDGRVLATGRDGAQVYDPASGNWTATGPLARECCGTLQMLQDGRVLDIGGPQVYDPASGNWTATGKRNYEGFGAAVVLLSDGKVLVAGGRGFDGDYYDLNSAEVYDPVTGSWTATSNMHAEAYVEAAFLQPDGKVLVVGSRSAEVYDPATGTWTALPGRPGIQYTDAMLLSDGTMLVTGEVPGDADQSACTVDVYDPRIGSWTSTSTLPACGPGSLTPLLDGTFLGAGGSDCQADGECGSTGTAELYVPAGVALPPLPAFPSPPPYVLPSPTPVPPLIPPADGPVPPNARSWTITVDNQSSEPATLFVAESGELRLVGSATPNVVPAGATVKVTFLFPANGVPDEGWITVNPRQGDGADSDFIGADEIGMAGKIYISPEGDWGWVGPP